MIEKTLYFPVLIIALKIPTEIESGHDVIYGITAFA